MSRLSRMGHKAESTRRRMRALKGSEKYLKLRAKEGYFIDVPNHEEKSIKEVHSPTLRRWIGIANKYIALVSDIETVNYFIEKKREIEIELSDRPDGLL